MVATFPIPTLMYLRYAKLQQAVMKRTDERLGVVGELLNSARVVKYFAWERAMMARIDEKRDAEQKMIWKRIKDLDLSDGRRDDEYLNLVHQQGSSVDKSDRYLIHLYNHPKTATPFEYRLYRNHTLPNPLESIHLCRHGHSIDCQRNPQDNDGSDSR
jgi:ABC transporter transmembrane region